MSRMRNVLEYLEQSAERFPEKSAVTDGICTYTYKELLAYLIENKMYEFKPVDVAGALKVTNKTVINRCAKLYSNGFVVPVITGVRIMAYRLTDYTISNADTILKNIL